jgi:nitroimidazol reductase NimA-like FMN-containing flavoprotein (pyridoxamine 5'-phosphate oxidase superfamily)
MGVNREQIPVTTKKGTVAIPGRLKDFDAQENFAVLATDDAGSPYASLISYALTPDLKMVIFATPKGTRKYRNILNSSQVALLIDNRSTRKHRLMETEAITVIGTAKNIRKGKKWDELSKIFLKKHPDLEEFLYAQTTALVAIEIIECVHVSHFQTLSVWNSK